MNWQSIAQRDWGESLDGVLGELQLVLVADDITTSDDIARNIAAVASDASRSVTKIWVTGRAGVAGLLSESLANSGVPVEFLPLSDAGTISLPDQADVPRYVAVARAGDVIGDPAWHELRRDVRKGVGQSLYAFGPDRGYALNAQLSRRQSIYVDRDAQTTWIGSGAFLLSFELLKRCRLYDLTGGLGVSSLFLEALHQVGRCRTVRRSVSCARPLEDALHHDPCLYDPQWYHELNRFFLALFADATNRHGEVPRYFQQVYLYLLKLRFQHNANVGGNKRALREDLPGFMADVTSALQYVADEVIVNPAPGAAVDFNRKKYLLELKGSGENIRTRYYAKDISLAVEGNSIASASAVRLVIETMNITKGVLHISGRYRFPFDTAKVTLVARYVRETYTATETMRWADTRAFGITMFKDFTFDLAIPLSRDKTRSLRFYLVTLDGETNVLLDLQFRRPMSRLTTDANSYWRTGRYLFTYRPSCIYIAPNSRKAAVQAERRYLGTLLRDRTPGTRRSILLRLLYFASKVYFRRQTVWIYFDKLYKAGDNGEYAYRYAAKRRDGIKKYYILLDDCPDALRFKKEGVKFVQYGSIRQQLLFLHASIVFSTHPSPYKFAGFLGVSEKHFRGLFDYQLICIQHGLSVQESSFSLNRVNDNMSLFCLASPVEQMNLLEPAYDYRPEQLAMTGLARYDGLQSRDMRQLLITPTWRTYLAAPYEMAKQRAYSSQFRTSDYFRLYSSLISDPRLLAVAAETNYRIVLLLHPVTSSQIDDFPAGKNVDVIASTGDFHYEKVLSESSLMVTDYSGVQFDFAYMYKPVVYFHPPELPPSYDEGYYDYKTMALGEITEDLDALVGLLCEYMKNDCAIKDDYRKRVDEFFTYHDRKNSERIYEAARGLRRKRAK